ncbi:hypothetical protein ACFV9E_43580 [Streptomyces sp. NPDC059835]|uniref:hypothetical protein n=1 Tax=Streptomyces sp. NPDC059835 TaxID=3346967 RepID=UPI003649314C
MLLIGVSTVVGCTPVPKGLLAVERTDTGGARALIAPCPGYQSLQFSVYSTGGSSGYQRWAVINDAMGGSLSQVELFSAPAGWSTTESALKDLKGAKKYTLTLDGAIRGRGLDGEVTFTPDQLEALQAGKVIVADGDGTKVVSRSAFMKDESARCSP